MNQTKADVDEALVWADSRRIGIVGGPGGAFEKIQTLAAALREAQAEIERLRVDYASALKSHAALRHHRAESRLGEQVVPVGELPVNAVKMKMQADAWLAVYDEVEPELAQDSGLGTGVDAVIRVIRRLRSLTPQAAHPER